MLQERCSLVIDIALEQKPYTTTTTKTNQIPDRKKQLQKSHKRLNPIPKSNLFSLVTNIIKTLQLLPILHMGTKATL
jgi:hypothetical protein